MDQEMLKKVAKNVFDTICGMLDENNIKYDTDVEALKVHFSARGDDLPIDTYFRVFPEQQVVRISSPMPFNVPEDKRADVAAALVMINYNLLNGTFCMDFSDGYVDFRMLEAYHESLIGSDVFDYMMHILWYIVDDYNDKLFALAKGMVTLDQFVKSLN